MLDSTQRKALTALLNHPVERIARTREDAPVSYAGARVDAHGLHRIVHLGVEVILEELPARVSRPHVYPSQSILQGEPAGHLPTVLPVRFEAEEAERAVIAVVALRQAGVVTQQKVRQTIARIVRIIRTRPKIEARRIRP